MAPKNRIIFDTDPGVDDMIAMLLALSSSPEELEVVMLSVTYGNVNLRSCLKNVMGMFHVLDKEMEWRKAQGRPLGFDALRAYKPIVAIGPEHALEDEILMEDGFHGSDGLHGVHEAHPHLSPADTWKSLFDEEYTGDKEDASFYSYFTPSKLPAHKEILRILREEPAGTISICAVGPLTNMAMAAAEDPETFLRVKELVVMGGAIDCPGNITPKAEFNTYADAIASARVFALTSAVPASTMPVVPQTIARLPAYPENLSKRLNLTLCPLDITTPHQLHKAQFLEVITGHVEKGSPLATWVSTMMGGVFRQIEKITDGDVNEGLSLHDPLTVWYMQTHDHPGWKLCPDGPEDIRIETSGQWTHGMHIVDRRGRQRATESLGEVPGDDFGWQSATRGNRVNRLVESPGADTFGAFFLGKIFG